MSDDRRRKRSWREIDRGKDRSGHRRVDHPGTHPAARRTTKSYKAELDRFFDSGVASTRIKEQMKKGGTPPEKDSAESPERIRLVRKIRSAETFDDFVSAVNDVRNNGGLPNDADILTRSLEHPDDDAIHEALERLTKMGKRLSLADMKAIEARLESLLTITDNPKTLKLIEGLRAKM